MAEKKAILAHHELVIQSLLREERWRVSGGKTPRDYRQIAEDWVEGQKNDGALHYRVAFSDQTIASRVSLVMGQLIREYDAGDLNVVEDFSQKRDGLCDVCGVTSRDCWRQSDLSIREAIEVLRNG